MTRIRRATALLAGLAAVLAAAPAAMAKQATGGSGTTSCIPASAPVLTPLQDQNNYFLAPDGGFEAGASGWTLTGGAATVAGNETWLVNGTTNARALSLPAGSSATSPTFCVNVTAPSMRFFLRNTGAATSQLALDVVYKKVDGTTGDVQVGTYTAGATWQLSPSTLYYAAAIGIMPATAAGLNMVAFRFHPLDATGSWAIDDVEVDPFKKL